MVRVDSAKWVSSRLSECQTLIRSMTDGAPGAVAHVRWLCHCGFMSVRSPVLTDRLRIPLISGAVARPELTELLGSSPDVSGGWKVVSAPAGWGKTTLMAQYADLMLTQGAAVPWVSLTAADNDPALLWSAILSSCLLATEHLDHSSKEILDELAPPREAATDGFLAAFLDWVEKLSVPLTLVIDEVQLLESGPALDSLVLLSSYQSGHLNLVLGCRWVPAEFRLARARLEGAVTEVRAADLAFNSADARTLIESHGIEIADDELQVLLDRTEGWVAGLALASLAMPAGADLRDFLTSFAADARPLAEYLVSEVLQGIAPDALDLLVTTSILEMVPVELAVQLSGHADAGEILASIAERNAFIQRTGAVPAAYRYHSLLRGYLQAELSGRAAEVTRLSHAAAAEWYASQSLGESAIAHAQLSGDRERIIALVVTEGIELAIRGSGEVVREVLAGLNPEELSQPLLALTGAVLSLMAGDRPGALRYIDNLDTSNTAEWSEDELLLHSVVRLSQALLGGDGHSDTSVDLQFLGEQVRTDPLGVVAAATRGRGLLYRGRISEAEATLITARDMAEQHGYAHLELDCLSLLAISASALGHFGHLSERTSEAMELATKRGWAQSPVMLPTYAIAAWAAWVTADDAGIREVLQRARAIAEFDTEPQVALGAGLLAAYAQFDQGRDAMLLKFAVREVWTTVDTSFLVNADAGAYCIVEHALAQHIGDAAFAAEVMDRAETHLAGYAELEVLRAMEHFRRGRVEDALVALKPVTVGGADVYVYVQVHAWLLAAAAYESQGREATAHDALTTAIDIAAQVDVIRPFLESPAGAVELLRQKRGRFAPHEDIVDAILAAADRKETTDRSSNTPQLTKRETELLRELPSLLTVDQIASARQLSASTIKTHLKSIYRKLDTHSRRDAVERARSVGLL